MSQLTYNQGMSAAFAGMVADDGESDVVSKVNPLVAIPFGVAVCRGVNPDRDVKLPTSSAEAIASLGVARSDTIEQPYPVGAAVPQFPVKSSVPVFKKGRIWVLVEEAVTPASPVYIRYATGSGTQLGAFRTSADTSTAAAAPAGWAFKSSGGAGALVILEVNLP